MSIELRLGFKHILVVSPYHRPYCIVLFSFLDSLKTVKILRIRQPYYVLATFWNRVILNDELWLEFNIVKKIKPSSVFVGRYKDNKIRLNVEAASICGMKVIFSKCMVRSILRRNEWFPFFRFFCIYLWNSLQFLPECSSMTM